MASYNKYHRKQSKKAKTSFTWDDQRHDVDPKTGCQWRTLPKEFGAWQTVCFYFRKRKLEGIFEELIHHLRSSVRKAFGKSTSASFGMLIQAVAHK